MIIAKTILSKLNEDSSYASWIKKTLHLNSISDLLENPKYTDDLHYILSEVPSRCKLIPLGTYIGNMPKGKCNINAAETALKDSSYILYAGVIILLATALNGKVSWSLVPHFFNVKNGKVIEMTSSDIKWNPGDPIYYYGVPVNSKWWNSKNLISKHSSLTGFY
jgi:hypothetical protein